MATKKIDYDEVVAFLETVSDESSIYIGCDSERFKKNGKWYGKYTTVICIHKDSSNGCRVFGETVVEPDYDHNHSKPTMRMVNEAMKAAEAAKILLPLIEHRNFKLIDIHLDINKDPKHGSNAALQQAVGYVKGVTGLEPNVKPNAMAASFAADQYDYRCNLPKSKVSSKDD
jgi:predicted RNase H-related nuclease YkuK (DUF458 family)